MSHPLLGRDLRSSPCHELVLYDRLPEAARSALAELARDPGFYGVLRDKSTAALKSVDRDTALLFHTLREPGPLPAYVRAQLGDTAPPRYLHHPLVFGTSGEKLSKAARDTGIRELRAQGLTAPEVIGRAAAAVGLIAAGTSLRAEDVWTLFDTSSTGQGVTF